MDSLDCSTIIYRTITRRRDFRDGRPLANVFLRRPSDSDGISVDFNVEVPSGCAPQLSGKKAIISLHTGRLRDIGLDAVPDSSTHAVIRGLPEFGEDDLKAEQLAAKLAEMSRTIWTA